MKLKNGTVEALYYTQMKNPLYQEPVLQIVALTKFSFGEEEKYRHKVNLSDGTQYMKGVFSSELSYLFDEGKLGNYSLVKLDKYSIRPKETSNYVYILAVTPGERLTAQIGSPVSIVSGKPSLDPQGSAKSEYQMPRSNPSSESPQNAKNVMKTSSEPPKRPPNSIPITMEHKKPKMSEEEITEIKKIFPHKKILRFKGRVVSKSDIKTFTSQKGEGKVFSFEIADCSGQIKCVGFSDCVDKFYSLVEVNRVYMISNVTVKPANKKFSNNNSDFEIHLERTTLIERADDEGIPKYMFKFVRLGDLAAVGGIVDCLAVIKEVLPVDKVIVKSTGNENSKRDLVLVDPSGNCRLTLWGSRAEEEYEKDSVICLGSVRVGDYHGVNLSTISSSQILPDIDLPEAVNLLAWYQENGKNITIERPKKVAKRTMISEVRENSMEYATIQGCVMHVRENTVYYEACPGENCNKKVSAEDNGVYRCERCNYTFDKCNYRYMVQVRVGDYTGEMWITAFDEGGKALFGMTAAELKEMVSADPEAMISLLKKPACKEFQFRIKNKEESYNGDVKIRTTCQEVIPIDPVNETRKMLDVIEKAAV